MILDTLNNAHNYVNLHPQFGMVFDYLLHTDFAALTDGKRQLDGTDVYIDLATIQGRQHAGSVFFAAEICDQLLVRERMNFLTK